MSQLTLFNVHSIAANTNTPANPPAFMGDLRPFFSWRALGCTRGAGGVTRRFETAAGQLSAAIDQLAPGATGAIELVRLDPQAGAPSYVHLAVLARVRRDATGEIRFERGE